MIVVLTICLTHSSHVAQTFLAQFQYKYMILREAVHLVSEFDCLSALAGIASLPGYVQPTFNSAASVNADGGVDGDPDDPVGMDDGSDEGAGNGVPRRRMRVVGARHPLVEAVSLAQFVPNDIELDNSDAFPQASSAIMGDSTSDTSDTGDRCERFMVITGPNMGGKSSYIRSICLISLLAQMGSFVVGCCFG